MLPFFPTPYLEETYYSMIARYHLYSGNISIVHTMNDLFSLSNAALNPDLANDIDILLKKLPRDNLSVETILYDHTLLPYYSAFIPEERVKKAESIMSNRFNRKNLLTQLGISGSAMDEVNISILKSVLKKTIEHTAGNDESDTTRRLKLMDDYMNEFFSIKK